MATDGHPRTYTPEQREEALRLYLEVGAAEAARRLEIPAATVRKWAQRAGLTAARREHAQAAIESARLTWAQRRGEIVVRFGEAADGFLTKARKTKSARNARDLMAAADMAVKNAQLLSDGATGRVELSPTERRQRVLELRDKARDELAERRARKAVAGDSDQAEAAR